MKASKVKCPFFYSEFEIYTNIEIERCTLFETNEKLSHFNIYKRDSHWLTEFMLLPNCLFSCNPDQCSKRLAYKEEIDIQRLEDKSF